jgi:hypothetical protein
MRLLAPFDQKLTAMLLWDSQYNYICTILYIFIGPTAPVDPGLFFSFMIIFTDGRTPWTSDQHVARPLPKCRTTQTQNKHIHTPTPCVGFEPTIPASERAKTVYGLDRSAIVTGFICIILYIFHIIIVAINFIVVCCQLETNESYCSLYFTQ